MENSDTTVWLTEIRNTASSYRRMLDATVAQLSDAEFFQRPADGINSVAIIVRHLGGNLRSRWTDFFTTDGEKPDRDRDTEFLDWQGDRQTLMAHFERGWKALDDALLLVDEENIRQTIYIRGEAHSVQQAILRSITHVSYHIGQIAMIARIVHEGEWQWLTVAPGTSAKHNEKTWGTAASRSISGAKQVPNDPRPKHS